MTPRPYQQAAVDATCIAAAAGERPILVSPTGSGKSAMGSMVVKALGVPTLWLAHRKELVDQAVDELHGFGIDAGMCVAGRAFYQRDVTVGTFGTVANRRPTDISLIIADECHHLGAKTFRKVIDMYPSAMVVGLTATPFRLDGRGLGGTFKKIITAAYADELIAQGYLVEPKVFAPPPDALIGLKVSGSDFSSSAAAKRLDNAKLVGDVVETWMNHARGYRTAVYASSIEHSKHIVERFCMAGVKAEHVDAKTPAGERKAILDRIKSGETLVVSNKDLLTEGWNVPGIECVSFVRPTASLCLHLQVIGRACRVHATKRYPIVLDHAANFIRHGRMTRRIDYSLEGGAPPATETNFRQCPRCFRLLDSSRRSCPSCLLDFSTLCAPRPLPRSADGSLQAYTSEQLDECMMTPAERAEKDRKDAARQLDETWYSLIGVAKSKGFKPAWASCEYERVTKQRRPQADIDALLAGPMSVFTRTVA